MTTEQNKRSVPHWLAILIALAFWIIGIPLVYGVGPWALSLLTPHYGWVTGRPSVWNLLGLIPVVLGTVCLIWIMVQHFAKTPDLPERIELEQTPKYLLLGGLYMFTRNPMYLAELTLLIGWTLFYGSIAVFIACVAAGVMFNIVIVPHEEHELEARFGEAYREYKRQVPRWFGKRRM